MAMRSTLWGDNRGRRDKVSYHKAVLHFYSLMKRFSLLNAYIISRKTGNYCHKAPHPPPKQLPSAGLIFLHQSWFGLCPKGLACERQAQVQEDLFSYWRSAFYCIQQKGCRYQTSIDILIRRLQIAQPHNTTHTHIYSERTL